MSKYAVKLRIPKRVGSVTVWLENYLLKSGSAKYSGHHDLDRLQQFETEAEALFIAAALPKPEGSEILIEELS